MWKLDKHKSTALILLAALIAMDCVIWREIWLLRPKNYPIYYALDVGQGDATLIELPGGVRILTDAGPDRKILNSLERSMAGLSRIDLAIISHPQLDHFNGYNFILEKYEIGALIINGRMAEEGISAWPALLDKIRAKKIPILTLAAGDKIHYGGNEIEILSPDPSWIASGELNDTGLVELVKTGDWTALLTADTGTNLEDYLFSISTPPIDILKVGHHGSKYSTGAALLEAVQPKVATVSVGRDNRYGHPSPSTLERLNEFGVPVVRTDEGGTIEIYRENNVLKVRTEK